MFIYPYKAGSESVKNLCTALGTKRIKLKDSKFVGNPGKFVVNWGASKLPDEVLKCRVLNKPDAVALATNKLKTFNTLSGTGLLPEFTESRDEALKWINEGVTVVCRTLLEANSGRGIVMATTEDELVDCKLYVKYVKKTQEYRVHVLGRHYDIQRKARRKDVADEDVNWQIRNHDNGFIFARNDLQIPAMFRRRLTETARKAVKELELDFGAVDIIYNAKQDRLYVLEVNTAPGLSGTTLESYQYYLSTFGDRHLKVDEGEEPEVIW